MENPPRNGFPQQSGKCLTDRRINITTIGKQIKTARKFKKWSQKELGELIGLSSQAIGQFERGDNSMTVTTLIQLADVLEVTTNWLLGRERNEKQGREWSGRRGAWK